MDFIKHLRVKHNVDEMNLSSIFLKLHYTDTKSLNTETILEYRRKILEILVNNKTDSKVIDSNLIKYESNFDIYQKYLEIAVLNNLTRSFAFEIHDMLNKMLEAILNNKFKLYFEFTKKGDMLLFEEICNKCSKTLREKMTELRSIDPKTINFEKFFEHRRQLFEIYTKIDETIIKIQQRVTECHQKFDNFAIYCQLLAYNVMYNQLISFYHELSFMLTKIQINVQKQKDKQ